MERGIGHKEMATTDDTPLFNALWAKLMIEELAHHGVGLFCISPGSYSTPLTVAAAQNPLIKTHVHYDERGIGFYALGYSKSSKCPAALIVTSGTAVANLLPAVMESHHDHIPLILITADRPPELRNSGADQTTDQVKIFENFIRWQVDMPCPNAKIPKKYIGSTISQAISSATSPPAGPVHINCMLRQPFLPDVDTPIAQSNGPIPQTTFMSGQSTLNPNDLKWLTNTLPKYEKGVILASNVISERHIESLYALSHLLQWPIFPDILSSMRSAGIGQGVVPYYDLILKTTDANDKNFSPDAILQFGDRFVSKNLSDWITSNTPKMHCHVTPHIHNKDYTHSITHHIACTIDHFIRYFSRHLPEQPPSRWFRMWRALNEITSHALDTFFKEEKELSEPLLFHHLSSTLTPSMGVFLSNSMPVRNAEAFFLPQTWVGPIFCNRGLSGIDGNIASACGIARGLNKPILAILGDLAFLHDINSLSQIKNLRIKILVINNNGGSIFSFLPIAQRRELCSHFFTIPHGIELKCAAPLFGLSYTCPQTLKTLQEVLTHPSYNFIEIQTSPNQNVEIHQKILNYMREIQSSAKLTV